MDTDDRDPAESPPRPGDGRDPGPRPVATLRDGAWGLLAAALYAVTTVQFVGLAVALVRLDTPPSGTGPFLGFLVTVVWLLTIHWFAVGAWRRSVWGCPFQHAADAQVVRRCPRHATVEAAGTSPVGEPPADPATR